MSQNSAMDLHLNGKVVLITGGTDGLGAALASRLVEEGARVAVCTRLAVPHLITSGGGAIVNVLNTGARAPGAGSLPTTASRAAGLAITKAASKDLGGHGIRVNAVLVGLVASGQWRRRADAAGQSEEQLYRQLAENADIPLGRVGRSEEFADLAAYLLSDRSSYVTGSAVNLDGGSSPAL